MPLNMVVKYILRAIKLRFKENEKEPDVQRASVRVRGEQWVRRPWGKIQLAMWQYQEAVSVAEASGRDSFVRWYGIKGFLHAMRSHLWGFNKA